MDKIKLLEGPGICPSIYGLLTLFTMDTTKVNHAALPDLAVVNQQIVAEGEHLPSVVLSNGQRVQTGTVAAMLYNVKRYNAGERGAVEQELLAAIPTLVNAGLFDLFPVEEWLAGSNAGRAFVGRAAQEFSKVADQQLTAPAE